MAQQGSMFEPGPEAGRTIRHRNRKAVTFKGGLDRLAHRWFRLTPSFSPDLVSELLAEFSSSGTRVLDPFSGRGTTPIECQLRGVPCTGIEINPLLHFVGRVSLDWSITSAHALEVKSEILQFVERGRSVHRGEEPESLAGEIGVGYPKIHNVSRWWRQDVLRDLILLKGAIAACSGSSAVKDFFRLALANMLLDASNITLGRLQLHFIDRDDDEIDALALFDSAACSAIDDLSELNALAVSSQSIIHHGDTRRLSGLIGAEKYDLVITSPPYPNRYSYVWNTRPHLYMLEMFENSRQAGALDCETIGGTWGTATSRHSKGVFEYTAPDVGEAVGEIVDEVRAKDLLMSNYVAMYFDDLYRHICELKQCLRRGAVCAYVVGNSRIKKSLVETDLLLSRLFQAQGFREVRLEQIRKRNSGKELHETIVIAELS